jgi:RHS repeat-associated protein
MKMLDGQLATYQPIFAATSTFTRTSINVWFGSKLIRQGPGSWVMTDRLGSVRANSAGERFNYYPYGQEMGSTADGRTKFATYYRDAPGMDYANQRYYAVGMGRFNTPDPAGNAFANASNPISWNQYGYVYGDLINYRDLTGRSPTHTEYTCEWNGEGFDCDWSPEQSPINGFPGRSGNGSDAGSKGGLHTDPTTTGRTAWQYLTSTWGNCLNDFKQDGRFDASSFQKLLQGTDEGNGIQWLDSRSPDLANRTVNEFAHNGDTRKLSQVVAGGDSAVTIPGTHIVVLGANYFTDNTQTEQIAIAVHEALHMALGFDDGQLAGWLGNFGFKVSGKNWSSHEITDWIVGTADHMSTKSGGCKNP